MQAFSTQHIRAALLAQPSTSEQTWCSDLDLQGDYEALPPLAHLKSAAILLPLVQHSQSCNVLLTQRTSHLNHHPGQICFPGGRQEAHDPDLLHTALRETWEEIGLSRTHIEIAGFLDNYITGSGFLITPAVGFVRNDFQLKLDDFEVADVFEMPLSFILDPANHQQQEHEFKGQMRRYYQFDYQGRIVWGATAGILMNFYRRLCAV